MDRIRAVIFDCDGTLVDSEEPGIEVLHAMACDLGLSLTRDQALRRFRGVRMAECIQWIGSQLAHRPADFEERFALRLRSAMAEKFRQGLNAMPGAAELLERLTIPFCVATNGPREKVELTLSLSGLRPYFGQHVFTAFEVGIYKPDPGLFLHAAQAMQVPPMHCAVVEDSMPGIQAGLAAGMQVFSLHPVSGLPQGLSERIRFITCLSQLAPWLTQAQEAPGSHGCS